MNRFRSAIAAALVAAVMAGGAAAYAQGPRAGGPGGGQGRGGRGVGLPLASLNLTQAQQDLIRDIRERGREQAQQLDARMREAQAAQRKAVSAIPLNEAAIRSATLALAEVQVDAAIQQARVQSEIFAALTPAQQEQARQALAAREQRPDRGARRQ